VHGANLELQPEDYRKKVERLRTPLMERGVVQWMGPYQPHELRGRMAGVDWVVVPSIWWENSPMVIQEAFVCGRPLLVSDLGGMKEKVVHGFNGFTIPGGNTHEWSSRMREIVSNPQRWNKARINISKPMTQRMIAAVHLKELSY